MEGFIKLARCLLDKPILQNPKILQVWVWCLLKATHKEHEQLVGLRKIPLHPGQFITGRFKGASELKMNPSTFRNCLEWLKENQSITIKVDTKFSLVSIVNWRVYQVELFGSGQQNDSKMTTKGQQNDTNKNVKNDKKKMYAEKVKFTEEEHAKLIEKLGQRKTSEMITRLSEYKISSGKSYASDYQTILNWVKRDGNNVASKTAVGDDLPLC